MTSTPPPTSLRARTPPTPLHGSRYDNYEPYSPRRSTRSTAQSNPYSSVHSDNHQRSTPPPTSGKRARFAHFPTQLTSPPSSPASPVKHRTSRDLHKTPRKQLFSTSRRGVSGGALSDSDGPSTSLVAPSIDPVTMLPTPSKTPKKRHHAVSSTARILSFQPNDPNDIMPSPRKIKRHSRNSNATSGFELYDDDAAEMNGDAIAIYTDANARMPEVDESEDNPFVGPRKTSPRAQRKKSTKSAIEIESEAKMEEAVRRDEGVTYVFRGRKVFRRFADPVHMDDESLADTEISGSAEQRSLRRKAGAAAQRPLTRSTMKPRLLFPSEEQLRAGAASRAPAEDEVDEEAVTDVEMSKPTPAISAQTPAHSRAHFAKTLTPPSTRTNPKRSSKKSASLDTPPPPVSEAEDTTSTTQPNGHAEVSSFESSVASLTAGEGKRKARSPFESWPRTKSGKKRTAGEEAEEPGIGKRTRSGGVQSPL